MSREQARRAAMADLEQYIAHRKDNRYTDLDDLDDTVLAEVSSAGEDRFRASNEDRKEYSNTLDREYRKAFETGDIRDVNFYTAHVKEEPIQPSRLDGFFARDF